MIKKTLCLFLFTSLFTNSFSQIVFEKGYFIDNNNVRSEVLIKNVDWKNSPKDFQYKTESSQAVSEKNINDIKEFGVYGYSKYQTRWVEIDQSPSELSQLTTTRAPQFLKQEVALKVLMEGSASLYVYVTKDMVRYFYKLDADTIKQLVYKRYLAQTPEEIRTQSLSQPRVVMENKTYKQQLYTEMNCIGVEAAFLERTNYIEKDLIKYFVQYNTCKEGAPAEANEKPKRKSLSIRLTPGVAISKLSLKNSVSPHLNTTFKNAISYRMGAEVEIHLPFNKNKWSVVVEPSYFTYASKGEDNLGDKYEASYRAAMFLLGPRYTFFLNADSKIFLNAMAVGSFPVNKTIGFRNLEPSITYGLSFGAGYAHKRLGAEVRYYAPMNLLPEYSAWSADYSQVMLILGVRVF